MSWEKTKSSSSPHNAFRQTLTHTHGSVCVSMRVRVLATPPWEIKAVRPWIWGAIVSMQREHSQVLFFYSLFSLIQKWRRAPCQAIGSPKKAPLSTNRLETKETGKAGTSREEKKRSVDAVNPPEPPAAPGGVWQAPHSAPSPSSPSSSSPPLALSSRLPLTGLPLCLLCQQ